MSRDRIEASEMVVGRKYIVIFEDSYVRGMLGPGELVAIERAEDIGHGLYTFDFGVIEGFDGKIKADEVSDGDAD